MAGWLESGRRRDLCVILAGEGPLQAQALKTRLEDRYGSRIDPQTYYAMLEALVDRGVLETQTEGIHDVYELSDAGQRRLREQYEWIGDNLEE